MVKRVINLLNKEFSNINQAAIILGFFTLLSQILALFRDRAFAHFLGPSAELDIYYASFKIPDFLFLSIASLASVTVILPFLVKKIGGEEGEAKKLLNNVFSAYLIVMVVVSIALFFLMPEAARLIAPGFTESEIAKLVEVSRIMLLSPILLGLSNLLGSVTQMFKKFFVFALSPVFYNLGIIAGVFFLYPIWGLKGLAIGVVFGAFLHMAIQIPVLIRQKFLPKFQFKINWASIKEICLLSLPRTLGLAFNSLALIVIIAIASKMGEGSISIFQFSLNLQNVPLGIIGVSYAVAAFPTLSQYFSGNNMENFVSYLSVAARQIVFWALPVTFLFIVLRAQIVRVILGTGSFTWDDTRLTAAALALFVISLVGQCLILLFTRAYYAAGNTKRPLVINFLTSVFMLILVFWFVEAFKNSQMFRLFFESLLRVDDLKNTELLMLPLAYSIGSIANFVFLWIYFCADFKIKGKFIFKSFCESFAGAFFMGCGAYLALSVLDNYFNINTFWGIFAQGSLSGLFGIIAGVIVLRALKNQELNDLWESIKSKKLFKTEIISSGQEEI